MTADHWLLLAAGLVGAVYALAAALNASSGADVIESTAALVACAVLIGLALGL